MQTSRHPKVAANRPRPTRIRKAHLDKVACDKIDRVRNQALDSIPHHSGSSQSVERHHIITEKKVDKEKECIVEALNHHTRIEHEIQIAQDALAISRKDRQNDTSGIETLINHQKECLEYHKRIWMGEMPQFPPPMHPTRGWQDEATWYFGRFGHIIIPEKLRQDHSGCFRVDMGVIPGLPHHNDEDEEEEERVVVGSDGMLMVEKGRRRQPH